MSRYANVIAAWMGEGGGSGENGHMYMYGWVALLSTWNYHHMVYRPYPDTK